MSVYRCLDYYTAWFNNVSMRQVWEFLGFNFSDLFYERAEECNTKGIAFYTKYSKNPKMTQGFYFNNVYVGLDFPDFYKAWMRHNEDNDDDRLKICDEPGRVYVTLPGSALAYVRQMGVDVEKKLCNPSAYLEVNPLLKKRLMDSGRHYDESDYKPFCELTRVDFAFDFINEHNDIYSQFFNYCVWLDKSGRRTTSNLEPSFSCKYSARFNDQRTVYFGNSNTRLLRCYDKLYQIAPKGVITDARDFPYREDIPINEVQSWQRIEYQTRTQYAMEAMQYLEQREDLRDVWYLVCKHFDFVIPDDMKPRSEWKRLEICERLFNPDFIPHIILNNHYSVTEKTPVEKAENAVKRALPSILGLIAIGGYSEFIKLVNNEVKQLCDNITNSPLVELRLSRLKFKVLEILESMDVSIDDSFLSVDENGNFFAPYLFDKDGQYIDTSKILDYIDDDNWLKVQGLKGLKNENRKIRHELDFYKLWIDNLKRRTGQQYNIDLRDSLHDTISYFGSDYRGLS